jgi:hypothetical protein
MTRRSSTNVRDAPSNGWILTLVLALAALGEMSSCPSYADTQVPRNAALYVISREILFFSAHAGVWTSVRLDAGERVLQFGADGNIAAVLTSSRAVGFSAVLNITHEIRVTEDEGLEAFKVEGNVATLLTRRRALGFSVATGKWAELERFQLGR